MKIVFYDAQDYEIPYLKEHCPKTLEQVYVQKSLNGDSLDEKNLDADIICVFTHSDLSKEILSLFKNLKFVLTRSVGHDHIDLEYCKKQGIKVFFTPHYGNKTVAEYTFGLMLSVVRKISLGEHSIKQGQVNLSDFMGLELYGKTLGIIGLGQIGECVAKIASGFEMRVVYFDKTKNTDYKNVDLEVLCKMSDFISLHCPLNEDTKHILSDKEFNIMKQGVTIINVARGENIDTRALLRALDEKKVAYAGLDVVECEHVMTNVNYKDFCTKCVSDSCLKKYILNQKLLSHPNVIITPHIAYNTKEAIGRILNMTIQNIDCCVKSDFCNNNFMLC